MNWRSSIRIVISRLVIALAFLVLLLGRPDKASAGLEFQFTAEFGDFTDPYGLFRGLGPGDLLNGRVRYGDPIPEGDGDPFFHSRTLPVFPGGVNHMSLSAAGRSYAATQEIGVGLWNEDIAAMYGVEFTFIDGDASLLDLSGLPAGYTVVLVGSAGVFTSDPTLFPFPNLPTELHSLSLYYDAQGFLGADVYDDQGRYVRTAGGLFQLTSLNVVPEPSAALLYVLLGLGSIVRRRVHPR